VFRFFEVWLNKALKRGVKVRLIFFFKPQDEKALCAHASLKKVLVLRKNPRFEMRCTPTRSSASILVFDKKIAFISTVRVNPTGSSGMLINYPSFVGIIRNYYGMAWREACTPEEQRARTRTELSVNCRGCRWIRRQPSGKAGTVLCFAAIS
jgi:hypothetical protein